MGTLVSCRGVTDVLPSRYSRNQLPAVLQSCRSELRRTVARIRGVVKLEAFEAARIERQQITYQTICDRMNAPDAGTRLAEILASTAEARAELESSFDEDLAGILEQGDEDDSDLEEELAGDDEDTADEEDDEEDDEDGEDEEGSHPRPSVEIDADNEIDIVVDDIDTEDPSAESVPAEPAVGPATPGEGSE